MMQTPHLSHARAITPIKDVIHDTIRLTCFEREIVDSRYFQRLHFVLQNSVTFCSYPSNKTSRFSHSLGVSNICGNLLLKSLSNSKRKDLKKFLKRAATFINEEFVSSAALVDGGDTNHIGNLEEAWKETISGQSRFTHSPFLQDRDSVMEAVQASSTEQLEKAKEILHPIDSSKKFEGLSTGFIIDTLWEAVRICGLVHDIGHLPMSHSFEGALERIETVSKTYNFDFTDIGETLVDSSSSYNYDLLINEYGAFLKKLFKLESTDQLKKFIEVIPVHERRTLYIFHMIFSENKYNFSGYKKRYRQIIFWLAFLILISSCADDAEEHAEKNGIRIQSLTSFLRVLKTIVAGEIDGDRLDYTIRDGVSCGSSIGQFDLSRIIDNSILIRDDDDDRFRIIYYHRAVSGIEQYFHQRYEGYKYLIYHRTSSRTETCLQELIAHILLFCFIDQSHDLTKEVADFGYIDFDSQTNARNSIRLLPLDTQQMESLDDANLRTLLFRIKRIIANPKIHIHDSLKDVIDKIDILSDVVLFRDFQHIYNPFKHKSLRFYLKDAFGEDYFEKNYKEVVEALLSRKVFDEYAFKLRSDVHKESEGKVFLTLNLQKPKIYNAADVKEDDKIFITEDGMSKVLVEDMSPVLRTMGSLEKSDLRLNLYFVQRNIKSDNNKVNRQKLKEFVFERLLVYFKEISSE